MAKMDAHTSAGGRWGILTVKGAGMTRRALGVVAACALSRWRPVRASARDRGVADANAGIAMSPGNCNKTVVAW